MLTPRAEELSPRTIYLLLAQ